jgi:hypothetical protein
VELEGHTTRHVKLFEIAGMIPKIRLRGDSSEISPLSVDNDVNNDLMISRVTVKQIKDGVMMGGVAFRDEWCRR